MKKKKRQYLLWLALAFLGIVCISACSRPQHQDDVDTKNIAQEEGKMEQTASPSPTGTKQRLPLQELSRQNIISDGEYLYTLHRQADGTDFVQILRIMENGLEAVWNTSIPSNGTLPIEPNGTEAPENTDKNKIITVEYPFGRDLNLLLEIQPSGQKTAKVRLVMTHPSTGERLQKLSFSVGNTDWIERISENIIVDHQHCYIGIGSRNRKGQRIYQLFHYSEVDGFRKLTEYNWGKSGSLWESCGWIRGNDVYIFSPDGQKSIVYNAVSGKLSSEKLLF